MVRFLVPRVLRAVVTVLVVLVLTFAGSRVSGDPIAALYREGIAPELAAELRRYLGLDRPIWEQFVIYVWDLARGDVGRSIVETRSVALMYWERLDDTLTLAGLAFLVSATVGVALGVLGAWRRGTVAGEGAMMIAFLGYAVPNFVLAILLILLFGYALNWLPTVGNATWAHYVMPTAVLAAGLGASVARFSRASLLDALSQAYVRTATAKGLPERRVVFGHALRNALIPTVTVLGLQLIGLVNGSVIVESVFAFPGIGQLLIGAVRDYDYPVLQFGVICYALIVVTINLVVDLLYAVLDPRIRVVA
jgi:peptide/nickel transport system permease protein